MVSIFVTCHTENWGKISNLDYSIFVSDGLVNNHQPDTLRFVVFVGDFVADSMVNHHHQMDVSENSGFSPQIIH